MSKQYHDLDSIPYKTISLQQICFTKKTDSMQTILSSAKSVFSLCGRYCPHNLQRCFPADENQMKNRSAHDL